VPLGEPKLFLDGQVRVERLPSSTVLRAPAPPKTEDPVQDDYPAFWVRYKTKKQYFAWLAYQREKDRVLLAERDGPDGAWSSPLEVAGTGDHFRVALSGTHGDQLWVVWASQRDKAWGLFARPYKNGKLGDEVKLTEEKGPNFWHRMTTDSKGRAWLVWQAFRDGKSEIHARCADAGGWHDPVTVSATKGNCWAPSIAADRGVDRIWVAWDCYESGNYQVQLRSLSDGPSPKLGEVIVPAPSARFQANANVAVDDAGRLWVAWDESGPQWGKDTGHQFPKSPATGIYQSRSIEVRCLVDGKWLAPKARLADVLPIEMKEFHQMPQMQADGEGRLWLSFRYRTCKRPRIDNWAALGRWDIAATAFLGDRWLPPIDLPRSAGRNDMRVDSQRDREGNVYFAYASDNRTLAMRPQNLSVAVTRLNGAAKPTDAQFVPPPAADAPGSHIHARETEQVARIRGYKLEARGRNYRIYRGDLHRHTDISGDGAGDGSLLDLYRYAFDAATLDFILVADHNMGDDNDYTWWRTQKSNDLYTVPGAFISLYGYERSVPYPNGHRNVIWLNRGHRTLPLPRAAIPAQMQADTGKLYDNLRQTDAICTLHSSATGQGTNWNEDIDARLEPIVELFQGFHASFEAPGAPRSVDVMDDIVHSSFKPDGYISLALDKGKRLGFQASSDHVSTHMSYACVLAEEFTRKGLIDAMKARHTYAATDNIVLDVRMGGLGIMGDEVQTAKPALDVVVLGTGPIDRVDIIRDGEVVHSERPAKDEARFHWDDPAPPEGDKISYYYVRVVQKDRQMAWGSPIWVKR
jgi:hypothetical protein